MLEHKGPIYSELRRMRLKAELLVKRPCSPEENEAYRTLTEGNEPLPEGVYRNEEVWDLRQPDSFYTLEDGGLTEGEKQEYILLAQLDQLRVIKGCVIFFTVLTVLSLVLALVLPAL
ncbi:MAG: hypothetical protein IKD06_03965 [Clostridia bacterium]|nr:hypothetical protein [Clostridia bacterium]